MKITIEKTKEQLSKEELKQIKQRQTERKDNKPSKVGNEELWQMGSDILENQARIENKLNELLSR